MKCPHCGKDIRKEDLKKIKVENLEAKKKLIYEEICNQIHSISSLSRRTKIKRSTLNYYLNILLEENKVFKTRLENLQGRPEIIRPYGRDFDERK